MNILIDWGGYECENLGDVAMLQVAVRRLRDLWPNAIISVIASSAAALGGRCADVKPVRLIGRDAFFYDHFFGPAHHVLPRRLRNRVATVEVYARRHFPGVVAGTIAVKRALRGRRDSDAVRDFVDAVRRADLLLVSGGGFLADAFVIGAFDVLSTLEFAAQRGVPTAALGQGIGPANWPPLRQRMREVLPLVDLIGVREGRNSVRLLQQFGVHANRVVLTGDDAIEPAHAFAAPAPGDAIGVNLRVAGYASISESVISFIRPALHAAARRLAAPLVAVPIACHQGCSDSATIAALLQGYDADAAGGAEIDTPEKVMAQVARCRIVVGGSYHSAVFALAQGLPVVCLARSQYYAWKFSGLADLFPGGCNVLRIDSHTRQKDLATAIDDAWHRAPVVRESLLAAARRQIDQGRSAYRRLPEIVAGSALGFGDRTVGNASRNDAQNLSTGIASSN